VAQFPTDTALAAAQSASVRRINGVLEFDWNRDGNYTHAYSDLSKLALSAVVDDSRLTSQLPSEIQSTTGYSSGELRVTLAGKRAFNEYNALQIFFPYNVTSPLVGLTLDGTPVRYSRKVRTSTGGTTVRQFTGFLRQYRINRKTGNVELICSDISDVSADLVTLPRWAVGQGYYTASDNFTSPIDGTWVYEEILRQAGRPTGPATPPGCVAYCSLNGSTLPSVGNMLYTTAPNTHGVYAFAGDPWQQGKYGLAPQLQTNGINDSRDATYAVFGTNQVVTVVPGTTTVAISFWHKSDGTAHTTNVDLNTHPYPGGFSGVYLFLEGGAGVTAFTIQKNGQAQSYTVKADGSVHWQADYDAQAAGWHYYHMLVTFTSTTLLWTLKIDGVTTTSLSVWQPITPWAYVGSGPGYRPPLTNIVQIYAGGPIQHAAIRWSGAGSTPYTTGEENPPTRDGKPLAYVERSALRLLWLPEVYKENAWSALTKLSAAELGATYTDVWGSIHCVPHSSLNADINAAAVSGTIVLTEDQLQDLTIAPTLDARRNSVSISTTERHMVLDILWTQPDAQQFHVLLNQLAAVQIQLDNAIAVNADPTTMYHQAIKPLTPYSKYTTVISAILDNAFSTDATTPTNTNVFADCQMALDQRSMTLIMTGGTLSVSGSTGAYVGSYLGGQDASTQISGTKYSDPSVLSYTYEDLTSIAHNGRRVLPLGENDWIQTSSVAGVVAGAILVDTSVPLPVIDGVSLRADPRIELRDVYKVRVKGVTMPDLIAQVIGIKRSDTLTDSTDSPVLRIAVQPGAAMWDDPLTGWDIGSWSG